METAEIAKVAVSAAPYSIDKPYDYIIPEELSEKALPGVRVLIPFGKGNRESEGMILSRTAGEVTPRLKSLHSLLDDAPVLDEDGIRLALWMRQRYFCTFFDAIRTILPAGLWYAIREYWTLAEEDPGTLLERAEQIRGAKEVTEAMLERPDRRMEAEELRQRFGERTGTVLRSMQSEGLVFSENTAKRKIGDATRRMVELAVDAEDALAAAEPRRRSSPARYEVVRMLASSGRVSAADVCYFTGASMNTLRAMERSGIIAFSEEETFRIAETASPEPGAPITLNDEQQAAYDAVLSRVDSGNASVTLLEGVTGSGKTQVYIRLVQAVLDRGKNAMVLVPEIILTPQMMRKFSSYFGDQVVMLHSALRMTERYDQWKRIRRGEVRVVLGTRSAVFSPLKDLGLIVLDEEQENSYQSENPPRYHTRDVAKYLCARDAGALVLGSATPAVETAWFAEQGVYHKELLRKRYNEQALPEVVIADLRDEIRAGNPGMISGPLKKELEYNLEHGQQSILYLNRRGNSRMLLCGSCGYVPECPNCSVPMTFHSANGRLMCHYCGHSEPVFENCPKCGSPMKHIGTGTQKIEEELHELFPETRILRMDADTVTEGHEKILRTFDEEQVPILLGTQMVARGLDFENVTLVGVLAADLSLYVDHYRAAERTFSLLTQVIGRAGRGQKHGRAVIQTYTPANDVIQCAARQDYDSFYETEIRLRNTRRNPPFADLFTFTVSGMEESRVVHAANDVRRVLRDMHRADRNTDVLGPAPAPVVRVNNRFRYRCFLIGKNDKNTRDGISWLLKQFASDSKNRGLNLFVDCNTLE